MSKNKLETKKFNELFIKTEIAGQHINNIDLGLLNVTSGKIIVCDPLVYFSDTEAFLKKVAPGKYRVVVSTVGTENGDVRYAAAKLILTDKVAVSWENARTNNSEEEKEFFSVDAGLACFADEDSVKKYSQFVNDFEGDDIDRNIYDDYLAEQFKKNAKNTNDAEDVGDWLNLLIPNTDDNNVIMFHSGYGDGAYACYWGFDVDGKICELLIDFEVID